MLTQIVIDVGHARVRTVAALHTSSALGTIERWLESCDVTWNKNARVSGVCDIASDDWTTVIIERHRVGLNEVVTIVSRLRRVGTQSADKAIGGVTGTRLAIVTKSSCISGETELASGTRPAVLAKGTTEASLSVSLSVCANFTLFRVD